MIVLLAVAVLQLPTWAVSPGAVTVGDTVRLVRRVSAAPDVQARLRPLTATPALEPLSPPRAAYAEGELTMLYTVALFEPGRHAIAMPPAELLYPDGRVETIPGDTARIEVTSVIPADDTLPTPRGAADPLVRHPSSPVALLALFALVLAAAAAWGLARRRTRPRPGPGEAAAGSAEPPVERWVAAGESRAVAAVTADRLRRHIAEQIPRAGRHLDTEECVRVLHDEVPEWPLRETADVLRALERARFAPAVPSDVVELVERAERLRESLA
ncbi:MAG: hypothetical protein JSW43_11365 [Gemmatimonadota bacterium]|nr:MAG: hypothetical protein JSW43_11365 [Gemmatimonadota bacterium]